MTTFDQREQGFEAKFAADQKKGFADHARLTKLIGLWAAKQMGLGPGEAEAYAKDLVRLDVEKVGWEDVIEKIAADFSKKGVAVSATEVRKELERLRPKTK